jgi:hypothetical protein
MARRYDSNEGSIMEATNNDVTIDDGITYILDREGTILAIIELSGSSLKVYDANENAAIQSPHSYQQPEEKPVRRTRGERAKQ